MARLLLDLGAEVDGIGSTTLRVRCPDDRQGRARPGAGRPAARFGAAARTAAGAARPRAARAARRRFSGAPHDRTRISRRWNRWARASIDGTGHALEAPDGLKPTSIYLYEASVTGTETALLAAAAAPGIDRDSPRRLRAARRRAVRSSCEQLGVGITGAGTSTIRVEGGSDAARRRTPAVGRLHRGRQLGGRRRRHRRRDRRARRPRRGHGGRRRRS